MVECGVQARRVVSIFSIPFGPNHSYNCCADVFVGFTDLYKESQSNPVVRSTEERQKQTLFDIRTKVCAGQSTVHEKHNINGALLENIANVLRVDDGACLVFLCCFMENTIERVASANTLILCLFLQHMSSTSCPRNNNH